MSAIAALADFVAHATLTYRTGPEVTTRTHGAVTVCEVYAMPALPEGASACIDVGFLAVGFTEAAAPKTQFLRLLSAALASPGAYRPLDRDTFLTGPSYIDAGAWLGSQEVALRLYALLQHYGLARVITPAVLGIEGDTATELLGRGLVMFAAGAALREALDPLHLGSTR